MAGATNRRSFLKTIGAGIVGLAAGGAAGYLAAPRAPERPGETVTVTKTQPGGTVTMTTTQKVTETATITKTVGKPARGVPKEPLKIGLLNPISGGAAPLGDPGVKGAQLGAEIINEMGGILGRKIELLPPLDTRVKPDIAVDHFTRLAEQGVQYIIGGISSAVGLALADQADKHGVLWMPCEVWTPTLTEKKRKFTFRLTWIDSAAGVGTAYMALRVKPDVKTVAGINPDYAHGRTNWESFSTAIKQLKPDVEVVADLFPKLFEKDMTPFISELNRLQPDVIHSTSWGADILTIFKQGIPTGLFKKSIFLWVCNTGLDVFTKETWPNVWAGSQYTRFYPEWDLWPINKTFNERFIQKFGRKAFSMGAQSAANSFTDLLALKAGIERAAAAVGGWPEVDEVAEALVGITVNSPKGLVSIREDHDFWGPQVWALPKVKAGNNFPTVDPGDVLVFPPELTNPAPGVNWRDWIKRLKPIA